MSPKHIKKINGENRRAVAPYNFVELPEKVVEAQKLPSVDRYHCDRHTGRIECTLTTESPLYIRCGLTAEEFQQAKESKDLSDFFYTNFSEKATKPVIPGSSLRGMLRTLVEIVSFSKIDKITSNKLCYRSLGDPIYQANFVENIGEKQESTHPKVDCYQSKVHAGFLRKQGIKYIIEECKYGRIDSNFNSTNTNRTFPSLSSLNIYIGSGPGKTPIWDLQHKTIYVDIDSTEQNYFFPLKYRIDKKTGKPKLDKKGKPEIRHPDFYLRFRKVHTASFTDAPGLKKATLVITGDMQHKHLEFVFLDENVKEYSVSEEMIGRFQDDDQITKWQEDAFPKSEPSPDSRKKNGYFIKDELLTNPSCKEPVFFLVDEQDETKVRFLGRAQMFRLPYDLSPLDLVPEELRKPSDMDIAEAIFGYVNGEAPKDKARAGRIFISDATCTSSGNVWWKDDFEKTVTPKILASPKPTTFQHYLVQTSTERKQLKHYSPQSDSEKTVIRGHKLYWHKPHGYEDIEETDTKKREKAKLQYTAIKPIKAGIAFKYNIYFENLSDVELGALLWVLSLSSDKSQILGTGKPEEKYCFSLGMGKPLGMGAVKIDYNLYLSDRSSRYSNLFNDNNWKTGEEKQPNITEKQTECIKAFEDFILDSDKGISNKDRKTPNETEATSLKETQRIEMLLAMLRCDQTPNADRTRYMTIEAKEYQNRPVLPTPLQASNPNGTSGSSRITPKPVLKGKDKGSKPIIKKSQQVQQKPKPKDNKDNFKGSNFNVFARPPKPRKPKR
ncbi:MAG: TIGR03986 family CRISPR-associated RAMP protein [Kamptonema sp. SIO1D9]|nr:TIGR03986 family CRISPR-associated RAMP protein [Kamptonema sp. SIO1D9]